MIGWAVELSEFDICYKKGHFKVWVLANFITELVPIGETNGERKEWTLLVDGVSNQKGSDVGIILEGPDGDGDYIIKEVHEGIRGTHISGRALASKIVKFLIVPVDYFTKWVETEPMVMITVERIKKISWKKLICRFGLPSIIILDNDTQFIARSVAEFCSQLRIKQSFTSVEHPQTNGQASRPTKWCSKA
ncbi:Pol polyprotein, partial [Mucuna pruriens]